MTHDMSTTKNKRLREKIKIKNEKMKEKLNIFKTSHKLNQH
jgi:hypothetical protein